MCCPKVGCPKDVVYTVSGMCFTLAQKRNYPFGPGSVAMA